jgi:uncharacterized protein (TIGR02646 family)
MIKLNKTYPAPASLSSKECVDTLEQIRQKEANGETITSKDFDTLYGKEDVRQQLMDDQSYKCAYCESTIRHEQRHVDHYRPKSIYHELAFKWDNLVGACWACNKDKGKQFPLDDESKRKTDNETPLLINPYLEDPSEYIAFHKEIAFPKKALQGLQMKKAETTIKMLLEDPDLEERRKEMWHYYTTAKLAYELTNSPQFLDDVQQFTKDEHQYAGMLRNQQ